VFDPVLSLSLTLNIVAPCSSSRYFHFIHLFNCTNITVTTQAADAWALATAGAGIDVDYGDAVAAAGGGIVNGGGIPWWNRWVFGNHSGLSRPKLLVLEACRGVLVEGIVLHNSPSFNLLLSTVLHAEIRHVTVVTDRKHQRDLKAVLRARRVIAMRAAGIDVNVAATPLEPEDLNTDGIDFSGRDIWVHDCNVQNDDDSIAVKPCDSKNCQVQAMIAADMLLGSSLALCL